MKPEYDITNWTVYEPAEFLCINAYTGSIKTPGAIKPVFILELYNDEKQISIIKFFNCKKTKKGNLVVDKNSDFACIYRISLGEDPSPRYSKAKQLLGHLIGLNFICEYEQAKDRNGSLYFRAKKMQPAKPQTGQTWFSNGKLKNKKGSRGRRRVSSKPDHHKEKSSEQRPSNKQAITEKNVGNDLETSNPANTIIGNGLGHISSAYQDTTYVNNSVGSLRHEEYMDVEDISDREHVYRYQRKSGESDDEYIDRVINHSLSLW